MTILICQLIHSRSKCLPFANLDYSCLIPMLRYFGVDGISIETKRCGLYPFGGGLIQVVIPHIKSLESVSINDEGKIKKIRGVAYSSNVNPTLATRMIDTVRGVFNDFLPDVWIHGDHYKKDNAGLSKGYGISLVAETTTECHISTDRIYNIGEASDPEKMGEEAAINLLNEIHNSGSVNLHIAPTIILLMGLSSNENVSDIKLGRLLMEGPNSK
jgi:RNA 3'-terminal phosphate cyclase-like protein